MSHTTHRDLSRPRFRQLAAWIRDTLDSLIAREGPDIVHPDNVLTLHKLFVAPQHSPDISATTLRATRIHTAVMEVADKATRWPDRLADECDKVLWIWRERFGSLEALWPFLYARGGSLETVAGVGDVTRAALRKRWMDTNPKLMSSGRSRRHGDLGFQPRTWWLNTLFAFHDGIIDLESTDWGICCDSNGAYAIVLKDADEIESATPTAFTYRSRPKDAGRFRLTSADFKSRYPVRVLRSHSPRSPWAPRAGVRYEGLHRVAGWIIRSAIASDISNSDHILGDLIFEIKFEREDVGQASMDQVMMHPLASEIDDYAEYKHLHRLQRETMRYKGGSLQSELESREIEVGMNAPSTTMLSMAPSTACGTSAVGLKSALGTADLAKVDFRASAPNPFQQQAIRPAIYPLTHLHLYEGLHSLPLTPNPPASPPYLSIQAFLFHSPTTLPLPRH